MREEAKQALSAASPGAIMLDLLNFSETCGVSEKLTRTPLEDLMHPPRDSNVPLGQAGLAIAVRVTRLKQWAEVGPASLFRDGPRRVDPSAAEIRIFLAADDDLALAAHCVQTDVRHASPTDLAAMDIRELAKLGQGSKEASEVLELRRALLVEFAVTNYDSPAVARIGPLADGNPDDEAVVQLDALCRSLADHFGDQCAQIEKAFSEEFARLNRGPHFFSQPPGIGLN